MALNAAIVFEVRLGGNDTNGGGFKTGATGTDWTLQDAAQYSVTDGVTAGTTNVDSATANFGTDVVGNVMYIQGGTGSVTAGWYEIISRTSATRVVVDRSTGLTAGTGVTLHIGGAFKSPGAAAAVATVALHTVFIKYNASPYVITSASTNIAEGCPLGVSNTAYCGYDTTRSLYNTDANRPTIQLNAGVTGANMFAGTNNAYSLQNVILDANSVGTSACGFQSGEFWNVKAMNATTAGLKQNTAIGHATFCEVTGCTAAPLAVQSAQFCIVHDNTLSSPTNIGAFGQINGSFFYGCIAYGNNCIGFALGGPAVAVNCIAYNNTLAGFDCINAVNTLAINCISESNATYGYRVAGGSISLINCASYLNTTNRSTAGSGKIWTDTGAITGSGSFFTNAASAVFTLNNTAGAGALCRATGFPATFPVTAGSSYHDVGALQHQDAGGSSAMQYKNLMRGNVG